MKKFNLLVALLLLMSLTTAVFAQDEAAEPTLEERVEALEAAPASPLTVTGSLGFTLSGNLAERNANLPQAAGSTSATAKLGIASADEKVTGSIAIDLLAVPSVATTITAPEAWEELNGGDFYGIDEAARPYYEQYLQGKLYLDFFNAQNEYESSVDGTAVTLGTLQADIEAIYNATDVVVLTGDNAADAPDIAVVGVVSSAPVANESIVLTETSTVPGVAAIQTEVLNLVDAIIALELSEADSAQLQAAAFDNTTDGNDIQAFFDSLTDAQFAALTDDDRKVFNAVIDIIEAYNAVEALATDFSVASTVTYAPITGASLTLLDVAGLFDVTMNFMGQRVSSGTINVDGSGHYNDSSTTVNSYPSVAFALNEDVVTGLTAGLEIFFDDKNGSGTGDSLLDTVNVSDDIYTWLNEADDSTTKEEVAIGIELPVGYTMEIGDLTVGGNAKLAMTNVLGEDGELGYMVGANFAGFGATVNASFESALGLSKIAAGATYGIMGITIAPSLNIWTIADDSEFVFGYVKENKTEMDDLTELGGVVAGVAVDADLASFLPFAAAAGLDFDYVAAKDTAKAEINIGADVSVTPVTGLTVAGGLGYGLGDDPAVLSSALSWNASASYALADFTFSVSAAPSYDSKDDVTNLGWSAGVAFKHSETATINFGLTQAYNNSTDANELTYSVSTKVSF